ncbi:Sec-independent protein translocase protein TatB [Fuscibacter oryzae]|uniref:Twin-arginine translocase subunit TatB n=1 Tax=Fuscibacter oryzae TaxID=2803939 RepID=A0A8J7MTI0_9RHOB|nr:twin-arginine translocase subunit TatB [Fuscibacter oryzae]
MFGDIGWAEMLLIGIVALIVIGPQDLPDMFRQIGRFTAKLRQMSREFSRAMEQAANESGVKDVARDVTNLTSPKSMGLDAVKTAADRFEKWDPLKNAATPTKPITAQTIKGPTPPEGSIAAPPAPAAPVVPSVPVGPATQAEYDKKAAKAAILRDTTARLKAIDAGEAAAAAPAPKTRAPRKKAEPAVVITAEAAPEKKPRAPRKKKADTE